MQTRRPHALLATDAWFFLLPLAIGLASLAYFGLWQWCVGVAAAMGGVIIWMRDPRREITNSPLGVVSPVDGKIIEVIPTSETRLEREALKIVIRVFHSGTYSVYSPIEGTLKDVSQAQTGANRLLKFGGLWVRSDEQDDVVVVLNCLKFLWQPRSYVRYGERIGQGRRCALVRMAHRAELYLPLNSRVLVKPGDRVKAGSRAVAELVRG